MTPVDPLSPPPRPAHAMRGGRLAAVVLAVLVAHGLLLTHWLQHSAATPDLAAATSPTARQPDRSTASVHLTPPTANPSVAQPNVSVAAQATNPDAPATRLPSHTRPQGIPLPATATPTQFNKQKEALTPDTKANKAITTRAIATPITTAPGTPTGLTGTPTPPNVDTGEPTQAGAHPLQDVSQAMTGRAEGATAGLAATVPGKLRLPPSTTLAYEVTASRKGMRFPATSTLQYTQNGDAYEARMEIKALFVGSRTQTSKGLVDPVAGLQPLRFGDKAKIELAAHFDRSRQPPVLRFSANTPDAPLQPYTQDRLSVLFQLAAMMAGEPKHLGPGSTIAVHTAGPRDADMWQFKVAPAEELSLPAGRLTAIHLVRTPMHAYDNQVEVWLAPSLGHLPVRVLWTQANGDVVDQRLTSHEP